VIYADTSALYGLLVSSDTSHLKVHAGFQGLLQSSRPIWTTSFVLVETMALLQHRIGLRAAQDFDESIVPAMRVQWVDEDLYRRGADRLWREDRRHLSLVDCVGFEFMQLRGIETAFAVDVHFAEAGFKLVPGG
jgi:uncharacterized protein